MTKALARRAFWLALICAVLLATTTSAALAQAVDEPPGRDQVVEEEILDRLALISPEAVPFFDEATQALDAGELEAAEAGFRRVLELAPRFPDASRRLSQVALAQGDIPSARQHAHRAQGYDPAPANLAAVAESLVAAGDDARAGDALTFARAVWEALPEDARAQRLHVRAAVAARVYDAVEQACRPIAVVELDDGYRHYCAGIALAEAGQWTEAEAELLESGEFGVPAEDVEWALANDIRRRAWFARNARRSGWAVLGYAVTPLYLLATGIGLGQMTEAIARRSARRGDLRITLPERFLHGAYRVTILATSIWYYASIPLLWAALVSAWVGLFLLWYAGSPIWIRVAVTLSLMVAQDVLAIVYLGLSARVRHPDPGRSLDGSEAPGLWMVLEELADRFSTRAIDTVYLIPDARISVQEEGRNRDLLRGKGQRSLVLGLGLVPGMTVRQLKAVLAHEYAHFANRDTAGGQIARQVHASMQRMAVQLTMIGQNKWYNPGWWYVSVYTRVFLLVTMGASRLHEILADRAAAATCSAEDFTSVLRHITRQDYTFSTQVRTEMRLAKEEGRPVANLYSLPPIEDGAPATDLEARIASAMERPASRFDTHLPTGERIELLQDLGGSEVSSDRSGSVWELFTSPEGLQHEMTEVVRATVRRREDRLLKAVAEAHEGDPSRLRLLWRRAMWWTRTGAWPWVRDK